MAGKLINVEVRLSDTRGDFNRMLKRFTKKVKKEKIIDTYKRGRFYEKPSDKRRREKKRGQKNNRS